MIMLYYKVLDNYRDGGFGSRLGAALATPLRAARLQKGG